MIMADVLKVLLLVLGSLIVFVSYWLAAAALFPRTVASARDVYASRPLRATVVGALVAAPLVVVGLALLASAPSPALKMLGVATLAIPVMLGLLGSAGLGERIGVGLPSATDAEHPWRRVLRGGAVLSLTFLLPVIGWLGVLPWTLVSGVGASVLALRAGRRAGRRAATPAPVAAVTPA
jgi:hypothetical protein